MKKQKPTHKEDHRQEAPAESGTGDFDENLRAEIKRTLARLDEEEDALMGGSPDELILWEPPADDFANWQAFTNDTVSYAEFLGILNMLETQHKAENKPVRRSHMTVKQMKAQLAKFSLENNSGNRARILFREE